MKGSFIRKMKRQAIKEGGVTFADRVRESVRTGKPVASVVYERDGKKIVAKSKP